MSGVSAVTELARLVACLQKQMDWFLGHRDRVAKLFDAIHAVDLSSSGIWLVHHANLYMRDFTPRTNEDGQNEPNYIYDSDDDWTFYSNKEVAEQIAELSGQDSKLISELQREMASFNVLKGDIHLLLEVLASDTSDRFLKERAEEVQNLKMGKPAFELAMEWAPSSVTNSDRTLYAKDFEVPPHILIKAKLQRTLKIQELCHELWHISRKSLVYHRLKFGPKEMTMPVNSKVVFIGHGRSPVWKELKSFLQERLSLRVEEFNSISVAGIATKERLEEMLNASSFAFLIMTAEDEQSDGKLRARENVVHEIGLFQGRLGFRRAIVLLEDGCEEFSNIHSIGQIRFPHADLLARSEEIRKVLEREGLCQIT